MHLRDFVEQNDWFIKVDGGCVPADFRRKVFTTLSKDPHPEDPDIYKEEREQKW